MSRLVALGMLLCTFSASAVETMRIAMGQVEGEVELSGTGLGIGPDSEDGAFQPLRDGTVRIRRVNGRLELDGAPFPGEVIRFRAGRESLDAGVPGKEGIRAPALGLEVRGDVVVRPVRAGLQLINVIPLEDYLAAVLGSEMPRSFPLEALKAQAVAARTYALHKKLQGLDESVHLGSSVLHQVYGGMGREDAKTRIAVQQTWGEVLTFDLSPIEAYFHASCGGRTEGGREALSRDLAYLQPVSCPCESLPVTRWKATLTENELERLLGTALPGMRVMARSATGRAQRLGGRSGSVDAVTFRRKVGYTRVKSLAFEVEDAGEGRYLLTGRGNGHGAGMCQWGAKVLADQGWDYKRILAHYYPGAELQLLY